MTIETNNVIFFNQLAKLRADPTMKNLVDLARTDPLLADMEINDLAASLTDLTPRENILWLLAYLQGVCASSYMMGHQLTLDELQGRLNKYWEGGDWRFRHPYTAKPSNIITPPPTDPKPSA